MTGNSYTLKEVVEHFLTDMRNDLKEIKVQTQRTNGRVTSLEKSRIQIWTSISVVIAVAGVIATLGSMVISSKISSGISSGVQQSTENIDVKIQHGVESALNERCGNPCVQVQK